MQSNRVRMVRFPRPEATGARREQTMEPQGVIQMSATRSLDRRYILVAVAMIALSLAFLTVTSTAKADTLTLAGGYTQLTTNPDTTKVLLQQKVLPLPIYPSWVIPTTVDGKLALRYRFYITGGQLDGATLGGEIYHSGGLRWVNLLNGKRFAIKNFTIDTVNWQLTAEIPALGGARAPILDLDKSQLKVTQGTIYTKVGPVPATLTATAAGALNQYLGVSFFAEGIPVGTANVFARFAM